MKEVLADCWLATECVIFSVVALLAVRTACEVLSQRGKSSGVAWGPSVLSLLGDIGGIVGTIVFVFIVIAVAEAIRRFFSLSSNFTRKVIHVGVGNWVFLWPFSFDHWYAIIVPPALFVVLNYVSYRRELFKAMERKEKAGGLGTVYYAISLTIIAPIAMILGLTWVAASAIILMAWADGLADPIGRRYGVHKYRIAGSTKSVEGSLGFFLVGVCSVAATLAFFGAFSPLPPLNIPTFALGIAALGTLIEAVSPAGTDNLTVPILSFIVALLFF
jgi:phytol kinase